ncbi:MAG: BamA/TamA family outer membrane protein [Bacteroidetes bacterium]|nr:BamA/TamA family outer membrane protein [Bacteroidota bacterium]MBS1977462.1 BamA/TamA family outer membrane protein [Bacteroidota bacterium]
MTRLLSIPLLLICVSGTFAQVEPGTLTPSAKKQKRLVLFPVLVKSPEYLWGAGVAGTYFFRLWQDSTTRTSNIKNVTFYTLRNQLVFASDGTIYFPHEKFILHILASFSHFPDRFWGIGNETPSSNMESYSISQYNFYPRLLRRVFSDFYLGVTYEFQNVYDFTYNQDGTSLFDTQNVIGRYGGKISGAGFLLTWDSRNNAFSSSKGLYVQYYSGFYRDTFGSDFNFTIRNLDIRKYFSLTRRTVLAFQLNLVNTTSGTPVRDLASIGSSSYMRGYYDGRYADHTMVALQTELRIPIYGRWGMTTFAGIGRVGSSLENALQFVNLKPSIGLGVRYALRPREKLNLRVDAGFGKDSQGTYINIGEAF